MDLKSNCVQFILYYGSRGKLVMDMVEHLKCDEGLASDFINKYFHFLTEAEADVQCKMSLSEENDEKRAVSSAEIGRTSEPKPQVTDVNPDGRTIL